MPHSINYSLKCTLDSVFMGISYLHLSCCFRFPFRRLFASFPCFSAQVSNYLCNIIKILLIHKQMRRERTQLGAEEEGLDIAAAFQHFINAKCCCCCCCCCCIIHKKCHKCRHSNNTST